MPFMGVHPKLRELLSDLGRLKHGFGVIWEFFALRIANARSVFKMKEIFHHTDCARTGCLSDPKSSQSRSALKGEVTAGYIAGR